MQNFSKIIVIFLLINPVFSNEPSFFMNDEDSKKALELAKESTQEPYSGEMKLSGIFFMDESNWVVWINGKAYSTIGQQGNFSIDEVSESDVTITMSDGKTIVLSVEC